MFAPPLSLKNVTIDPPLFLGPMAGITHSAFRRLVADFGGYGALFTEMLSGKALLHEAVGKTPFTKKRESEGKVWFQLALCGAEDMDAIIGRLEPLEPTALDINAACPAPEIVPRGFGAALFRDVNRFTKVLTCVRKRWKGVLTVKCRLGDDEPQWREKLKERLSIMEQEGIDAVTVHPRFFNEKLKRRARWELFEWIASQTGLPIIANGDILSPRQVKESQAHFSSVAGIMIGRMSVIQPWIFSRFSGRLTTIDHASIWSKYYEYVLEDFPKEKALGRIKEFSKYFAQNFLFGHEFYRAIQSVPTLEKVRENALSFLKASPTLSENPRPVVL